MIFINIGIIFDQEIGQGIVLGPKLDLLCQIKILRLIVKSSTQNDRTDCVGDPGSNRSFGIDKMSTKINSTLEFSKLQAGVYSGGPPTTE